MVRGRRLYDSDIVYAATAGDCGNLYYLTKGFQWTLNTKLYSGIICSLIVLGGCTAKADEKLETTKHKASYVIGVQLGTQMSQTKDDIDLDKVMLGLKESFDGKEPRIQKEEMMKVMQEFQQGIQAKQQAKMTEAGNKNAKEGEAFLAENKKKDGIVTLPSGLYNLAAT